MRAGARGGARVGNPRWRRILPITVGSSMAARMVKGPPLYEVVHQLFGAGLHEVEIEDKPGLFQLRTTNWMLPQSGVAIQLRKPDEKSELSQKSETSLGECKENIETGENSLIREKISI